MIDVRHGDPRTCHRLGARLVRRGRRLDQLCQLFDFGPTILELAGLSPPPIWRRKACCRRYTVGDVATANTRLITMIRTERDKAVIFLGSGEGQYFDLVADPKEQHNLWSHPEIQPRLTQLRRQLLEWRLDSSVHTMDRAVAAR